MARFANTSYEFAQQWDRLAEQGSPEYVPSELPLVGDFEYLTVPAGIFEPTHQIGGYDIYDDETEQTESLVIVGEDIPKHARPFLVAHIILHKTMPDDGTPHLCGQHDKSLQAFMSEAEPSLIEPFYDEAEVMYRQGAAYVRGNDPVALLTADRYRHALRHSRHKGELAHQASERRQKLAELGLVLPDGESALTAVDKRSGERTYVTLQNERGNRHKCADCSHPIVKGSARITTSTQQPVSGYDHHHYHPGCFSHVDLGVLGDFRQIPHEEANLP